MYSPLPNNLTIKSSPIHGMGLFATSFIEHGTVIGVSHIAYENYENGWIRTPLGGFYNHSEKPNCVKQLSLCGSFMSLVALQDISCGEELTVRYTLYSVREPAHYETEE